MDRRTVSLIAIIVTSLLCALPGLGLLCIAILSVVGLNSPSSINQPTDQWTKVFIVVIQLCLFGLGLLGVLTPILIVFFTRRREIKENARPPANWDEPIPPPG